MTQYKLKQGIENFQVVDGAFAGRKFVRGKAYGEVPPEEKGKFDEIKPVVINEKKAESIGQRSEASLRPVGAYAPEGDRKPASGPEGPTPRREVGGQKSKSGNP